MSVVCAKFNQIIFFHILFYFICDLMTFRRIWIVLLAPLWAPFLWGIRKNMVLNRIKIKWFYLNSYNYSQLYNYFVKISIAFNTSFIPNQYMLSLTKYQTVSQHEIWMRCHPTLRRSLLIPFRRGYKPLNRYTLRGTHFTAEHPHNQLGNRLVRDMENVCRKFSL